VKILIEDGGSQPGEGGFTLLEVVIAMVIFTVFCAAALGLLLRTDDVTKGNLQRTTASNLAAEQVSIARSQGALAIQDVTRYQRVPAGTGTNYKITQTTKYLASDSTTSVCSGSTTQLAYRLVTVTVTWPGMGSIQPVRSDTLKAVGVGSDGLGVTGALAVTVAGADGTGQAGQTLSLSDGSSATTSNDGCAVFVGLAAGTYTATLDNTGDVGLTNEQNTTKSGIGVTAGTVSRTSISYDTARSMVIALDSPVAGAIVPGGINMPLSSGSLAATSFAACPATGTPVAACATAPTTTSNGLAKELYPAVYTVKMGTCTETTPSQSSIDLRADSSEGSTATVPMGAFKVKAVLSSTPAVGIIGRTIVFTHASQTSGCTAGERFTMTSAQNGSAMMLPYGTWTVSVQLLNAQEVVRVSAGAGTATLGPSSRSADTTFLVQP
jgi:prepilin-type N-terminal cleavage/methylation domain-containing protein